jgi:hypothetical protein
MNGQVLGRYDAKALSAFFEAAGIYKALDAKGFDAFEVGIDTPDRGISHTRLFARKHGERHLLLDACITELGVAPGLFRQQGYPIDRALDLVSLYWLREEDPTADFTTERPPLPLQQHPGLGILRAAFPVVVRMARELGKDGVACMPKFFHDAVIFFHSRLFLFLDGTQQGRFEALARDLHPLPLGTASLLLAAGGVRDNESNIVRWDFAPQVFPLSDALRAYFNSTQYGDAVAAALAKFRFRWDDECLMRIREPAQPPPLVSGA